MNKTGTFLRKAGATVALLAGLSLSQSVQAQRVYIPGSPDPFKTTELKEPFSTVDFALSAQIRIIPTWEKNFDFGQEDNLNDSTGTMTTLLNLRGYGIHPRIHSTEAGRVSNEYWRTESKLNFEFTPKDNLWNLFISLECDTVLDMQDVDQRCYNSGIERLHATFNFNRINTQFHAGWDLYAIDAIVKTTPTLTVSGPVSIYGDDDPGLWFTGQHGRASWQLGWHKKIDNSATPNGKTKGSNVLPEGTVPDAVNYDPDRNIYDFSFTYEFIRSKNLIKFMAVQDRWNWFSDEQAKAQKIASGIADGSLDDSAIKSNPASLKTVVNYYGALYYGQFFNDIVSITAQYAIQGGKANNTGIVPTGVDATKKGADDYTIDANMQFINLTSGVWGSKETGIGGKLGLSYLRTSGDEKDDDVLEGWTGVVAGQRFSNEIGSEHSIMGEQGAFTKGNQLYGYVPEYFGSHRAFGGTGVTTGGAWFMANPQDRVALGGRGDNPGMTLLNLRFDNRFSEKWVYRLQYRTLEYNEDFYPYLTTGLNNEPVSEHKMGAEWGNELYYLLNWNAIITFAYTQFSPGPAIEKINEVYTGKKDTAVARRTAMEYIIRF